MILKTRAKINLSIDIVGKRNDLYDILNIKEIDFDEIIIKTNSNEIPVDSSNIVYKAIKLIKETYNINKGVEVYIEKNIPVAGGLAGGSTNCAGVLVGLNKIWNLNLTKDNLKYIGLKLGADVPFCIEGGSKFATNIGEKLTDLPSLDESINILVCKPDLFVSTKDVYTNIDINNLVNIHDNKYLIECLKNKDAINLSKNIKNVLENVTTKMHKEIDEIKNIMRNNNSLGTIMSGSGPTVFGLYNSKEDILSAKNELLKKYKQVYITKSSLKGVEIIDG